jgi:Response regulator containing CheY-like receiver domain and AraC-type DNA-binding domain
MVSILIADDEPLVVKGIKIMLENSSLPISSIQEAENGEEALQLMADKIIDIVITDIRMPKVDGLEFCRRIYKKSTKSSIVIISGYSDFSYAQEVIKYGVRAYLLKPVQKRQLIETISDIIKEREEHNRLLYVPHKELEIVLNKLETGIWNDSFNEIKNGLDILWKNINHLPMEFRVKVSNDLNEMLIGRLSLKIGYNLVIDIPDFNGLEHKSPYIWLELIYKKLTSDIKERRENADCNLLELARKYLIEHYSEDITLEDLAKITGYSPNYFSRLFKTRIGKTFVQFKGEIRILRAMEMFNKLDKTVTEVAIEVGYNDVTYFIRAFKEYTGLTPNEYKHKRGIDL